MNTDKNAIQVSGLTVAYNASPVLWNVDVDIPQGVVMGIIGPNGAGKSTLLNSILGLVPRLAGEVQVFGEPVAAKSKTIGYVPQRKSIDWDFPTTVFDLVMMGTYGRLGWFRRPGEKERSETKAALEKVELLEFADRQIGQLSGGQQQRAFLARAFVQNASLYLLDEPFAGVDATTERAIIRLLHELRNEGKTVVIVHHDLTTVGEYLDLVTLINREVVACGPVEKVFTRENIEKTYGTSFKGLHLTGSGRPSSTRGKDDA